MVTTQFTPSVLRILYSLAPLFLVAIPVPSGGLEDVEVVEQRI
jgi:hypothetical protein